MPPLQTKKNTQTHEKRLRVFMWPGGVKTPPYKSYFQGAVGVGVPDDPRGFAQPQAARRPGVGPPYSPL